MSTTGVALSVNIGQFITTSTNSIRSYLSGNLDEVLVFAVGIGLLFFFINWVLSKIYRH